VAKLKASWREKLKSTAEKQGLPKVVEVNEKMSKRWGEGTYVIPSPVEVDSVMKSVPEGRLITVNQIREIMAKRYNANFGWPITTGIFVGIAARAAGEDAAEGKTDITPYWRTVKEGGKLNEKYPGGVAAQAERLMGEGHEIEPGRGKQPPRVKDYERVLVEI
jgi:alkylated DNA nucleotide flippase Atl1